MLNKYYFDFVHFQKIQSKKNNIFLNTKKNLTEQLHRGGLFSRNVFEILHERHILDEFVQLAHPK